MDVSFVDTTFRDGSQSLWALGMRRGMIEAVAEDMGRAGFHAVEVPVTGSWIKAHKLFGAWRVDVFLDDEPLAIARQGFTILSSN